MMRSLVPNTWAFGRSLRPLPKLHLARAVGSLPRLDDQIAVRKDPDNAEDIPPTFAQTPAHGAVSTVRPVAAAMLQGDEFWRRVPLWENVSAADFLSYRWSVSLGTNIIAPWVGVLISAVGP